MTPGPTRVPERVLRAGARPMLHHRTPEFSRELASAARAARAGVRHARAGAARPHHRPRRDGSDALQSASRRATRSPSAATAGSARCGSTLAESYGLVVHRVATDWDRDVDPAEVERAARRASGDSRDRDGVQRHVHRRRERRRGVARVAHGARRAGARRRRVVDRRHAVRVRRLGRGRGDHGVAEVPDVAPGPVVRRAERARAWSASARRDASRTATGTSPRSGARSPKAKPETPGTPPVHIVLQVAEALRMIHEEGLDAVFAAPRSDGRASRGARRRRSDSTHAVSRRSDRRSTTVTAIALPPERAARSRVRDGLKARGILTAAGARALSADGISHRPHGRHPAGRTSTRTLDGAGARCSPSDDAPHAHPRSGSSPAPRSARVARYLSRRWRTVVGGIEPVGTVFIRLITMVVRAARGREPLRRRRVARRRAPTRTDRRPDARVLPRHDGGRRDHRPGGRARGRAWAPGSIPRLATRSPAASRRPGAAATRERRIGPDARRRRSSPWCRRIRSRRPRRAICCRSSSPSSSSARRRPRSTPTNAGSRSSRSSPPSTMSRWS